MGTRILVTGGAGFVGSTLALALKSARPDDHVVALDNLKRRGSELAIARLKAGGVDFVHGDVRNAEDLEGLRDVEVLLECSAEPSVQAGYDGDARYLVNTNLQGTLNCLEFARARDAAVIFLSTSRVYPVASLRDLPLESDGDRFKIPDDRKGPGWSAAGIGLDFPMAGNRTLYGATKLCSEHLIEEYHAMYGLRAVVNRCGVIAGPWQMGKIDQGFAVLWAARHLYGGDLAYHGFGGTGLQVRDILHVEDLFELIALQLRDLDAHAGALYTAGGGAECSISLKEATRLCESLSGRKLDIGSESETHPADIPYYVTDNRDVTARTGWRPKRSVEDTFGDIFRWLEAHRSLLEPLLS